MSQRGLFRRASERFLRKFSKEKCVADDGSVSSRNSRWTSTRWTCFKPRTKVVEQELTPVEEPIPEDSQPDYHQSKSNFFQKLPPEVRDQIYQEFWNVTGVKRHVFLVNRQLKYSPCITSHEAPDDRQVGIARDFAPYPSVQELPKWFDRLISPWCNHWRCGELWEDIQAGRETDYNRGQEQAFMSLLLSCKKVYDESIESFRESKVLNITDRNTLQRLIRPSRPRYFTEARYINISLRDDTGNWLYLNGGSLWYILGEVEIAARRIYLWLDAECPITRRLLPEFRDLYVHIPDSVAPRLVVDFPCDAGVGFWAWGQVEMDTSTGGRYGGGIEVLDAFVPKFRVVARGRPRFYETSGGFAGEESTEDGESV
ncbi:hypothetical protein CTRI78_v003569 [Colletotrichum trifolii]|uniref:DUF7730 domain-containing protein n=1 Tax=Colletotrichum trifolii TaxID=5466 RepID=A0A4R8RRG5_COLTR|nr:hypothetical protein CTRI78_v003569 [Colletotrichum trifolii]